MHRNVTVIMLMALAALAAAPACAAVGRVDSIEGPDGQRHQLFVEPVAGLRAVRYEARSTSGEPRQVTVRVTTARVEALDLGMDASGRTLFAAWDERGDGGVVSWFAVSQDGGRSFWDARTIRHELPMRYGRIVPHHVEPAVPAELTAPQGRLYLVQFKTISLPAWRDGITALGGEILNFVPRQAHTVRMEPSVVARVKDLPYVRWVAPYHPAYRLEDFILAELASGVPAPARRYHVLAFVEGQAIQERIARAVMGAGGQVVEIAPDNGGRILLADLTLAQVMIVAQSDDVAWIDRWGPPEPDMDIARQFHGAASLEGAAGYIGTGVAGEVCDGGTMLTHQDFDGLTPAPAIQEHPGTSVSGGDHGTCTYGIVFGNGARDGDGQAQATGMLPQGTGWVGDYDTFSAAGRKAYTQALVQSPMFCVFQSNSWGSTLTGAYTSISQQMDDIIFSYDLVILNSMSNYATNTQVRPQAWAKNIIAIGGIRHKNTLTASDDSWGASSGASIGPAEDGSIKPDLASFYDFVYTTDNEPGGYASGLYTSAFNGTSSATPIAAGAVGLFHQMWADNVFGNNPAGTTVFEKRPHAITARAMMQNQAFRYPIGQNPTLGVALREQQGWGMPNVQNLFDNAARMNVIDETAVLTVGASASYCIGIPAGTPDLKITMSYLDIPGTTASTQHRINDLSLTVTDPVGTVYYGNNGLVAANVSSPGGAKDDLNVTEHVFIDNPTAGDWTIVVSADEVNQDAHTETPAVDADFALVVTGVRCPNLSCCGTAPANVDIVTGPGPGNANAPNVKGFNADSSANGTTNFTAYGAGGYGANVALSSIRTTTGISDILTAPGPGDVYGPQVRAFQKNGTSIAKVNFYAYSTLKYGANVSCGDVDGDGYEEILTAPGPGAVFGPHVRGWNFDNSALTQITKINFFSYNTLKYGAQVSGMEFDNDAFAEIVTGPGPSAAFGPVVRGFNYDNVSVVSLAKVNFSPYTYFFGVHLGSGDLDKDGIEEIVTAPGPDPNATAEIRGFNYDGAAVTLLFNFDGMPGSSRYGAQVDAADLDNDQWAEMVVGTGYDPANGGPHVRGWNYDQATVAAIATINFDAYTATQRYGVNVTVDEVEP